MKYQRSSSNWASDTPVISDVPRSRPGRSSVARIPAAKLPSPRNPSLDRHVLTAKQQFTDTSSTSCGGIDAFREDWVSKPIEIAVLRDRLTVLVASSPATSP